MAKRKSYMPPQPVPFDEPQGRSRSKYENRMPPTREEMRSAAKSAAPKVAKVWLRPKQSAAYKEAAKRLATHDAAASKELHAANKEWAKTGSKHARAHAEGLVEAHRKTSDMLEKRAEKLESKKPKRQLTLKTGGGQRVTAGYRAGTSGAQANLRAAASGKPHRVGKDPKYGAVMQGKRGGKYVMHNGAKYYVK